MKCPLWIMLITLVTLSTAKVTAAPSGTVHLQSGWGLGYATMRDMGVSPLSYRGPAISPTIGVTAQTERWIFSFNIQLVGSYLEDPVYPKYNFSTFEGIGNLAMKAERMVYKQVNERFSTVVSTGLAITEWYEIHYDPNFLNSSTGMSNFIGVAATCRANFMFGLSPQRPQGRIILHGGISVSPFAVAMRPGYAYIGNYSSEHNPNNATLDGYQWYGASLPHLQSSTGVTFPFQNGNSIGLEYQWMLTTTHNQEVHRYDYANHLLHLRFNFILKGGSE